MGDTYKLAKHVYFIGFTGAGKTSVASYLAQAERLKWADVDQNVELWEKRSLADILAAEGEEGVRKAEQACLKRLGKLVPRLIACMSDVVEIPEAVEAMKRTGYVVHLGVSFAEAKRRLDDGTRALADEDEAMAVIEERGPLYRAAADVSIDTIERDVAETAAEVRDVLLEAGVLVER